MRIMMLNSRHFPPSRLRGFSSGGPGAKVWNSAIRKMIFLRELINIKDMRRKKMIQWGYGHLNIHNMRWPTNSLAIMLSLCQIITVAAAFGEQGEETHTGTHTSTRVRARIHKHARTLKKKHTLAHAHTHTLPVLTDKSNKVILWPT